MYPPDGRPSPTLPVKVLSITEARAQLPDLLARFREAGPAAEPVVLGLRRHAEAVLVPYERYRTTVDDLEAAQALCPLGDRPRPGSGV